MQSFDVVVVGAGPAGLAVGLATSKLGLSTAVVGPMANPSDGRSAALFESSIALLKRLRIWSDICHLAEPLAGIRLIDDTGSLFRAPELTFLAQEIGLEAFGYSILNRDLTAGLEAAAKRTLVRIVSPAVSITEIGSDAVVLDAGADVKLKAPLVAAADGRGSMTRTAAGIEIRQWQYDQAAVVCNFEHTRPHRQISTEYHRRAGPLTVVPAPTAAGGAQTSSLVWVETKDEARRLAELTDAEFTGALVDRLGPLLGTLARPTRRQAFPLSGQTATELARNRVALIGEAGHVIPPIGAQGLNLSFRDAATLAELAAEAKAKGNDPGTPGVLTAYDAARKQDVTSRIWTIDLLNRSLLSTLPPVHFARGLGLLGLRSFGPLRRLVMREGVAPRFSTPSLMSGAEATSPLDASAAKGHDPLTMAGRTD